MPNKKSKAESSPKKSGAPMNRRSYCSLKLVKERILAPGVSLHRANLIILNASKWVNGTVLHYYFFDKPTDGETVFFTNGTSEFVPWKGSAAKMDVVRRSFETWKVLGIGLEFKEVTSRNDAEIRIGFMDGDGSWSYIGRDVLTIGENERTMNFGWDISQDPDTALHELGHSLGFPHEHQNPFAGIVWNEEAVYDELAKPPNKWSKDVTFHNIIRKIQPDTVQGSSWDPDSIMHYPFEPGLILQPVEYKNGLTPAGGLSPRDETWVKQFYPVLSAGAQQMLEPLKASKLKLSPSEQKDFVFRPDETRYYEIRTFGESDCVLVLFEEDGAELRYRTADDDSGEDRNVSLRVKLIKGHKYVIRVRLYYAHKPDETAIMIW